MLADSIIAIFFICLIVLFGLYIDIFDDWNKWL